MDTEIALWSSVEGAIVRTEERGLRITQFCLAVRTERGRCAQRIDVETSRLERYPELYSKTLNRMVRDFKAQGL